MYLLCIINGIDVVNKNTVFGYKISFYNTVDEINKYSIHYCINHLCQISSRQTVSIDDKIMKNKI